MTEADLVLQRFVEMGRLMKRVAHQSATIPLHYLEALRFIKEEDATMRSLAGYLHIAAPSATALIQTLAKEGLVRRVADKNDRRVVRLALTTKGQRALESAIEHRMRAMRTIVEPLSAGDKKDLARILSNILMHQNQ